MLDILKETARQLLQRFTTRHEVGIYRPLEAGSLLLRSQQRVEVERAKKRQEAKARRAARQAKLTKTKVVEEVVEVEAVEEVVAEEVVAEVVEEKIEEKPEVKSEEPKEKSGHKLFVTEQAAESKVNLEIDSGLVADWISEELDLLFLDVREVTELLDGHLEGALLMPMDAVSRRYLEISKTQKTVVYCLSGGRSQQIATWLRDKGYTDVWSMTGGFGSWLAQGGEYVVPPLDAPLRPAQAVRLSTRGRKRVGREGTVRGTVQEIRETEKGLRYTLGVPLEEGGLELITDLRRSDLALS